MKSGFAHRLTVVFILSATGFFVVLATLGWWAVQRIDERALQRETGFAHTALAELSELVPREQDGSAIWDEAVLSVRSDDGAWMAENLVEWVGEYFGHDSVYVLDPKNDPVRAAEQGQSAPASSYERERTYVEPLVLRLRADLAAASTPNSPDSTADVLGMGVAEFVAVGDQAVFISVRPILPSSEAVTQPPGAEYLHVSIQALDPALLDEFSAKFSLRDLRFVRSEPQPSADASAAVLNSAGRIVGFLTWTRERPAMELVANTAPLAILGVIAAILLLALLVIRLRRTSSELEISEAHAQYLAFHDPLTAVPNRALFEDRLERALAIMRRTGRMIALHYVDLDRFKNINDTLGHPAGDALIKAAAARLKSLVREVDTVARLGGDEFAIIQVEADNQLTAETLAERIVEEMQKPFDLSGDEGRVGASVGVTLAADKQADPQDMMRQADIALYQAKSKGRGRYEVFAGAMDQSVRERRELERDLRAALHDPAGGLHLVYQPIFDATSGTMVGAEALVRWDHLTRGRLMPDMFIGLAEERGLIDVLGFWVLRSAAAFAVDNDVPWVAVNISPMQFGDEHFAARVLRALEEVKLPPRRLEIEITEGLLLQNSPLVQSTLRKLRAAGVRIALDDFGTGYSSISYLRTYGVDKLKIDQSFVSQLGVGNDIDSIVKSIIDLAKAMHMKVTAEGVETEEQRHVLLRMGCHQLQGYLLSRPVSGQDLVLHLPNDPATSASLRRSINAS